MTTSESKGRFFYKTNRFTQRIESIRIANWNALATTGHHDCKDDDMYFVYAASKMIC